MIDLNKISTKPPSNTSKSETKKSLVQFRSELFELQNRFYSDGRFGLLIILQSMDISNKDYTTKQIFSSAKLKVGKLKPFKNPTEDELKNFLKPTILEAEP
ncbi:hypothetical protein [Mariniflexile sp.]|uniref:hypothetical protein n=1 Tax=Mariniflexile sp. TaxID=1979402 RepID=UPI004047CBED